MKGKVLRLKSVIDGRFVELSETAYALLMPKLHQGRLYPKQGLVEVPKLEVSEDTKAVLQATKTIAKKR